MTINLKWDATTKCIVAGILLFALGFLAGSEYRVYQIKKSISQAFDTTINGKEDVSVAKNQQPVVQVIEKKMNELVSLATIDLKVTKAEEKQIINRQYGSPLVAKSGTKFVIISAEITNTTKSTFTFSSGMLLVDSANREYTEYSDAIILDDSLNYKELAPSIKATGTITYEIPNDSVGYSLQVGKAGTNEVYKIKVAE